MNVAVVTLALSVFAALAGSTRARPAPDPTYSYPYTVGFTRWSHSPIQIPAYSQQPLGYHSNAFLYPSPQNVVLWTQQQQQHTPPTTTVVGHSKENDGKIVGGDTIIIPYPQLQIPVVQQGQKSEVAAPAAELETPAQDDHHQDAVVIENANQQPVHQPSLQLQVPGQGQQGPMYVSVQFLPIGFTPPNQYPYPTVGWIPNSQHQLVTVPVQPSIELEAPASDDKHQQNGADENQDDTINIEGPPPDDSAVDAMQDFESKLSESNPEENEMMTDKDAGTGTLQLDAPLIDDVEIDVAPNDESVADDAEVDKDVEAGFEKSLELEEN